MFPQLFLLSKWNDETLLIIPNECHLILPFLLDIHKTGLVGPLVCKQMRPHPHTHIHVSVCERKREEKINPFESSISSHQAHTRMEWVRLGPAGGWLSPIGLIIIILKGHALFTLIFVIHCHHHQKDGNIMCVGGGLSNPFHGQMFTCHKHTDTHTQVHVYVCVGCWFWVSMDLMEDHPPP